MLKLTLIVGPDALVLEGDVSLPEVLPLVASWLTALPGASELSDEKLRGMTARLTQATTDLSAAETADAAHTP